MIVYQIIGEPALPRFLLFLMSDQRVLTESKTF
jgi:hypothetical protein